MTKYQTARKYARRGFTLVEILIVVIILGILAAIVIPQFTNASEDARKSNMQSQLQTLRSQIELFKLQHRDAPPPATDSAEFWSYMTQYTTDDIGVAPVAAATATAKFGPYMQQPAINPLTGTSDVAAAQGAAVGWVYDELTGEIHGVNKDGVQSDTGEPVVAP
jgi:general secretion pathway protein G